MSEDDNKAIWLDIKSKFILKDEIDVDYRVLHINGEITKKTYIKFDKQLRLLENINNEEVSVIINSTGGSVYEAFAIMDRMLESPCIVNTTAMGLVASAALPIFIAGDTRTTGRFTTFMHHSMSYGTGFDNIHTHAGELAHSKRLEANFNKFLASRTLKPYSFWTNSGKNVDYYFTAEESIEFGVSHEFLKS